MIRHATPLDHKGSALTYMYIFKWENHNKEVHFNPHVHTFLLSCGLYTTEKSFTQQWWKKPFDNSQNYFSKWSHAECKNYLQNFVRCSAKGMTESEKRTRVLNFGLHSNSSFDDCCQSLTSSSAYMFSPSLEQATWCTFQSFKKNPLNPETLFKHSAATDSCEPLSIAPNIKITDCIEARRAI